MVRKKKCEFCNLAKKERVFYSDEKIVAFLAKDAIGPGQSLIIPRNHFEDISDLSYDMICHIFNFCKIVSKGLIEIFHADGVNVICNNGEHAGQSIPHLHVHVVPRFKGDVADPKLWLSRELFNRLYQPTAEDSRETAQKMRDYVNKVLGDRYEK